MRKFDDEIKELIEDIKILKLTKKQKETQLRAVEAEQREVQINKALPVIVNDDTVRDYFGKPIFIGDWVNVVKKGKYKGNQETLAKVKKLPTSLLLLLFLQYLCTFIS